MTAPEDVAVEAAGAAMLAFRPTVTERNRLTPWPPGIVAKVHVTTVPAALTAHLLDASKIVFSTPVSPNVTACTYDVPPEPDGGPKLVPVIVKVAAPPPGGKAPAEMDVMVGWTHVCTPPSPEHMAHPKSAVEQHFHWQTPLWHAASLVHEYSSSQRHVTVPS